MAESRPEIGVSMIGIEPATAHEFTITLGSPLQIITVEQ